MVAAEPDAGEVRDGDEVRAVDAHERVGPLPFEIRHRHAHEVARLLGVQPRVVALRLHVPHLLAADHAGRAAERDGDHLGLRGCRGIRRRRGLGLHRLDDARHRALQSLGAHGLQQVVDGGEVERLERALLVGGHEHEGGPSLEALHGTGEVEAVEPGHVDVEERGVDGSRGEQPDRLGARRGLMDDPDARILPEQERQLVDRGLLVVGDEHGESRFQSPIGPAPLSRSKRSAPSTGAGSEVATRPGCDFGTRIRTSVPAPTFVSTTSPASSPYTCRSRASTLRRPTCSPGAPPASARSSTAGSMPTPSSSTTDLGERAWSDASIVMRPPPSLPSRPWRTASRRAAGSRGTARRSKHLGRDLERDRQAVAEPCALELQVAVDRPELLGDRGEVAVPAERVPREVRELEHELARLRGSVLMNDAIALSEL
jgi:hypothetical protein